MDLEQLEKLIDSRTDFFLGKLKQAENSEQSHLFLLGLIAQNLIKISTQLEFLCDKKN